MCLQPDGTHTEWELRGGVREAFDDTTSPEALLAGSAGSGKTIGALLKLYWTCRNFPDARCLLLRKTRVSLTESSLVTWERDILGGPDHPMLKANPNLRDTRKAYRFPNGSVLSVAGLDKPDKTFSQEWDLIYVNECLELDDAEEMDRWLKLFRSLRAKGVPWKQLLGDCNPGNPAHWLKKRVDDGKCRYYHATHRDNPRYWHAANNRLTPEGDNYINKILSIYTGNLAKRFVEGEWAQAEGLFFDYDPDIHILGGKNCRYPVDWQPPPDWR
jgi:phage terminase large subunit